MKSLATGTVLLAVLLVGALAAEMDEQAADRSDRGRTDRRVPSAAGRAGGTDLSSGHFRWKLGPPLVGPASRPSDPCHAVKDPTVVRHNGRWHLFCSIRSKKRSHQIEYLSFADWKDANAARRHVLKLTDGYFCAPQVFYFSPQKKWYLIYQVIDKSRQPALQSAFSTAADVADPAGWSKPKLLFARQPENVKMWIDFWVICDRKRAHLFFTSLNGRMWRAETELGNFPHGWSRPEVVLRGDIFEASHTYRIRGSGKYLTIVEAQAGSRRYYKAYVADRLEGKWKPLAATKRRPFASPVNVTEVSEHWTDSFSHGELIRHGHDETLQVDPGSLRLLFQGVTDKDKKGKQYGQIPWRLGILEGLTGPGAAASETEADR